MTTKRGLYDGIVVACFATVAVAFLVGSASVISEFGLPSKVDDVTAVFYVGLIAALITFPAAGIAASVIGLPVLWIFRRRAWVSVPQYLVAGLLISSITALTVCLTHRFFGFLATSDLPLAFWIIGISGPVAALVVRSISAASI